MKRISRAIKSLCPNAEFAMENEDYTTIRWFRAPDMIPSLEELEQELTRLEEQDGAEAYKQQRRLNYPTIAEQLDMLWHSMDRGEIARAREFYDRISAVKKQFPR